MGHLKCQFQSVLRICRGAYIVNELTRSPHKFHVSLKQLISFEKPWHILQSAEATSGNLLFYLLDGISQVPAFPVHVSEGAWMP